MKQKMKLKFVAAGAALCALGMTGCSNETDEAGAQAGKQVVMTMQSATDVPQTRADYTEDGTDNTKMNFSWRNGDKMSVVVDGVGGNENCALTATAAGKSAPFSGTVTTWTGTKDIYAFYPYNSTAYAISNGTTALTLPNPQLYTIGGAISNSFMVGVGTATATGDAITASASLKQVMSIIKLNITNAPAKVTGVKLKCAEALFPTKATVTLSNAIISNPGTLVSELVMTVTDATTEATKAVSFAMFPTDLSGKKVQVEVTFVGGTSKTIEKDGTNFVRNMHYVMAFDGAPVASDYIEVDGIKVATGNLVANGANSCKIGAPTDGGLYFQFGSLVGWAGGANGDGTGVPASNAPSYVFNATGTVVPSGKSIPATWGDSEKWTGGTTAAETVPAANDPCAHYLGSDWRLPTTDEYETLFNNTTGAWINSGGWKFDGTSKSATHTAGLTFPASGYRDYGDGGLSTVGTNGYCWSASPINASDGYFLFFSSSSVYPSINDYRANGLPVRCVQNASN